MKVGISWAMSGYSEFEFTESEVAAHGHLTPEEMLEEVRQEDDAVLAFLVSNNENMEVNIYDVEEL